jgi:hypothetical protein
LARFNRCRNGNCPTGPIHGRHHAKKQ